MLVQLEHDGPGHRVPPLDRGGYRGPLPAPTAAGRRKLLMRALAASGLSDAQVGQLTNASASTVGRALKAAEADPDDSLPPEVPPSIDPPPPYRRPAKVGVSEGLIASLRADYAPGSLTDDGRGLGDLAEVREWLAGLRQTTAD